MTDKLPNKPLTGPELKQMALNHMSDMMDRDHMFNESKAYGRVGYVITITVQTDNPAYPEHTVTVKTQSAKDKPEIVALPIKEPTKEMAKSKKQRTVKVDNPNLERVRHKMPVKNAAVDVKSGKIETTEILYTPEQAGVPEDQSKITSNAEDKEIGFEF